VRTLESAVGLTIGSTLMGFDKKEMIDQLKFEIQMIERGGYDPSVLPQSGNFPGLDYLPQRRP
jgi:hypothetical protein